MRRWLYSLFFIASVAATLLSACFEAAAACNATASSTSNLCLAVALPKRVAMSCCSARLCLHSFRCRFDSNSAASLEASKPAKKLSASLTCFCCARAWSSSLAFLQSASAFRVTSANIFSNSLTSMSLRSWSEEALCALTVASFEASVNSRASLTAAFAAVFASSSTCSPDDNQVSNPDNFELFNLLHTLIAISLRTLVSFK